jgi:hypothetical protein
MGFGREVDDRIDPLVGDDGADGLLVGDIALDEAKARIGVQAGEVREVTGIGQLVEDDKPIEIALGQRKPDPIAANEPGAAGDENSTQEA